MFDTHCHLNFSRFSGRVQDVIDKAKEIGVTQIVVPGTDIKTSIKALELAKQYEHVYAAVGIHPHHAVEISPLESEGQLKSVISNIEKLLQHEKVIAVGEVGLDKHYYQNTKYADYTISPEFIDLQKELLIAQIKLATQYKKV